MYLSKMPTDVEAALYFDSEDQQIILNRDGKKELLAASKYQDRLENCVVYMDEGKWIVLYSHIPLLITISQCTLVVQISSFLRIPKLL